MHFYLFISLESSCVLLQNKHFQCSIVYMQLDKISKNIYILKVRYPVECRNVLFYKYCFFFVFIIEQTTWIWKWMVKNVFGFPCMLWPIFSYCVLTFSNKHCFCLHSHLLLWFQSLKRRPSWFRFLPVQSNEHMILKFAVFSQFLARIWLKIEINVQNNSLIV